MANISIPKIRRYSTLKPPLGSQINWSNPLSQGLVGCWLMSEGGGKKVINYTNIIYKSISGITVGAGYWVPEGYYFDGSATYIGVGLISKFTPISIVASIYPTTLGEGSVGQIFSKSIALTLNSNNWAFRLNTSNNLDFFLRRPTASLNIISSDNTIVLNTWQTVAMTYPLGLTATSVHLYKNGIETTYKTQTNAASAPTAWSGNENAIGGEGAGGTGHFNGKIRYVYYYNRVLSPSEIQSLYVAPYQMIAPITRRWWGVIGGTSAAVSGTVTTATEADIVAGGKTIILTLTGDTWIAAGAASFDLQRQAIINGLVSAQSELLGWNNVVTLLQGVAGVVRTSDTVVTITLDAQATYDITATETITATIPGAALTAGLPIVATPTFSVTATAGAVTTGILTPRSNYWGDI